jgi:SSS family solute:Na+ symporter
MKMPLLDLAIFVVFMVGIVAYGCSFYFRQRSAAHYTDGGGNLPAWAIGMSIFATFVSSISFLALPGSAYLNNWNGFVFSLSIPIASFMAVRYFVPFYRRINSISAYYFLESRFGPWARTYASFCYLLTQLARMGAIMYLLALPMNIMFGWSIPLIIVITGLSVVLYSMMGGIEAVIWTDAVLGFVLMAGALVCAGVLLFSMPEGPGQLFAIASAHHKFSLGSLDTGVGTSTFWVVLFYGIFINLQNYGIDQNYVQRYLTARTDRDARSSTLLGSLLYLPVSLLFFFIGTALFAYYQAQPQLLPEAYRAAGMADKVFPYFIVHGLPAGLTGLLIAAIFAAGMSTVSTSINSSATILLTDYYKRYIRPAATEKESMRVLYGGSLGMGLLSIGMALAMVSVKSALDAWWALSSVFSGGMLGLFLLGYASRKVRNFDAAIGVVVGLLVICWMSLSPVYFTDGTLLRFKSPFHANLAIVIGTTTIFIVGFLLSRLAAGKQRGGKDYPGALVVAQDAENSTVQ